MTNLHSNRLMNHIFTASISTASQIVFIDSKVADYQTLVAGVVSDTEVVIIEPNKDGIEQITAALSQKSYSTVHIVSHGSPGCLYLGNSQLSIDTLDKYRNYLKTWFSQSPLHPCTSTPLLLYGCNVAAGDAGAEFIARLHSLTNAEIAASTTRIGNAAKGGNWELDASTGLDRQLAFSSQTQQNYAGVLTVIFSDDFDGNRIGGTGNWTVNPNNTDTVITNNTGQWIIAPITEDRFNGNTDIALQLDAFSSPNSLITGQSTTDDEFTDADGITTINSPRFTITTTGSEGNFLNVSLQYYLIHQGANTNDNISIDLIDSSNGNVLATLLDRNPSANIFPTSWSPFSTSINLDPSLVGKEAYLQFTASDPDPVNTNFLEFAVDNVSVTSGLPWEPNPYNGGILVRGAAFLSCGTLVDNGLDSPVLAVERVDIDANGNPVVPASGEQEVANPLSWSHIDWTQEKIGNVYGTDVDSLGNMYAAASSNYGAGFLGSDANLNYGSIGGGADDLGAAGTVYKMDAVTGAPTVFVQLPQQATTITHIDPETDETRTRTTGPGLGNIHYDKVNGQFFVSNFEDGRIYRIDSNGNILDSYDPGSLDNGNSGIPSIPETVYGLTVSPDGTKLFYGKNKEVYSIDLEFDGSFDNGATATGTESYQSQSWTNYNNATETLHSTIPDAATNPFATVDIIISDLDFLPTGELLVGGRTYEPGNLASSYNHGGHNYLLTETTANSGIYNNQTEIIGFSTNSQNGGDDGYGGITYSKQLDDSYNGVFSSGDIINEAGPHGIAVFPNTANNLFDATEITPRGAIGYGGISFDAKGVGGDVDAFNPGSIQGNVSQDTTGDGNGDTNLPGVTLALYDGTGNNPITDFNGNPITTQTDANGNYVFDNLLPGNYTVIQTQPAGLVSIDENEGGADNDPGDNTLNNRISVTINPEENDFNNDFVEATPATIRGNVSEDLGGDVFLNNRAIAGVTVALLDSNGVEVDSTITNNDGDYTFSNVVPGNYTIVQTQPEAYFNVAERDGGSDGDTGNPGDNTINQIAVTVLPGEEDLGNDFVEGRLSLGSTVFEDTNNNGLQDQNENGISGVVVQLFDNNGNEIPVGADGILGTTDDAPGGVTTNNGNYYFDGLTPGSYKIVIPNSNFATNGALENTSLSSTNTDTADNSQDSDDNGIQTGGIGTETESPTITLAIGTETSTEPGQGGNADNIRDANGDMTVDFGFVPVYNISGTVLNDTNHSGAIDNPGDAPIAGVTVELFARDVNGDPTGNALASDITDDNGFYEFTGIVNGDYVIVQTQPTDYDSVTDIDGAPDNQIAVNVNGADVTGRDFLEEVASDYGDAPDSLSGAVSAAVNLANNGNDIPDYQTTADEGGAVHAIDEDCLITIGSTVDKDNGTPPYTTTATADDNDVAGDDEDGVFVSGTNDALNSAEIPAIANSTYSVDVVVNSTAPVVNNPNAATISGIAYRDYDLDGTQDPATNNADSTGQAGGEPGIEGVVVRAYDADGVEVASATTDGSGAYTLNIGAGQQSQLRLEFTNPDGFEAGGNATGEGDLTRFVDTSAGSLTDIDLALNRPEQFYSAENQPAPFVVVPCFVFGDQETGTYSTEHTLVTFKYDGSTPDAQPIFIADANEIGTVYGVAYDRTGENIYTAAYTKRHAGYAEDGAGAIYRIGVNNPNITSNADFDNPELLVDLNNIPGATASDGFGIAGTVTAANRTASTDYLTDADAFGKVGKTAFGDIEIVGDTLYAVELSQKRLYAIDLTASAPLTVNDIQYFDLPNPNAGLTGGRENDIRPFALGVNDGELYVGMVDSAENGTATDLEAYVYAFDPSNNTFDSTPATNFGLDSSVYNRGFSNAGLAADWQPWSDDFNTVAGNSAFAGYAQPMLTDIEFDNGSMVLGFRDRLGDQIGEATPDLNGNNSNSANTTSGTYSSRTAGDIVRAAPNGSGGFTLESDGVVPDGFGGTLDSTGNDTINPQPIGTETEQGLGNSTDGFREFYTGDAYSQFHDELSNGSLVQLPGEDQVMVTVFDPIYSGGGTTFDGGVRRLNNIDGSFDTNETSDRYRVFDGSSAVPGDNFSKQNGLGDIEAILDTAPIEVGNRIFEDKDGDGIQDANEPGIAGVTVRLFSGNTEIATTTTDDDGKYSFGGVNAPDLLAPDTAYEIRIDDGAGTPLESYNLTLQDATDGNANTDDDAIDSDAIDNAGTPTISFTTGAAGENNFTLDAGFTPNVTLVGWIDFDRSGTFDPNEAVTLDTANGLNTDGTANTLSFPVPADVEAGATAARFRVASGLEGDNLDEFTPNGSLPNGEVEDYMVDLLPTYTVSGSVLSDTNNPGANAIEPGDTGIPGVEVKLFADSNGDGVPDDLNNPLDTKTTGGDGSYSFTGLTDGNYVIVQTQPTDYDSVTDIDGAPDNQIAVNVNGADVTERDFLEEKVVAIGSTVFEDTNNNGLQDTGEGGINNVAVELYDAGADGLIGGGDDSLVGSTNTTNINGVDGNYIFDNLPEGNYYVSIPQSNFNTGGALENTPLSSANTDTADNQEDGDDNGIQASIGDVTNSPVINLTANSEPIDAGTETAQGNNLDNSGDDSDGDMTVDFGFTSVFTVSGTVFEDTNNPTDNTIDNGDTGIPDVEVKLFADSNGDGVPDDLNNPLDTTTTNTSGFYQFTDIGNGNYVVVQTQPTNYDSVTDSDGAPDNQIAVNVNNADSTDNNFLEERPAGSVSGRVRDTDNNGINNVTLNLINSDGQIVDTVTTNNNGDYTFDYVLPGNYTVQQVQPFGYNSVSEVEGGSDADNPGGDNTVNNRISVTVGLSDADGGDDVGNDFVEIRARDYGDAPDNQAGTGTGNYRTREADNGASHDVVSGLRIGTNIDTDSGTLQNTTATADDNSAAVDDEDGVTFSSNLQTDDTTYSVDVSVTNNTGQDATLVGWIDFDRSGTFDADEAVSRTIAAGSGTSNVSLTWDNDTANNGDGNGDLPGTGALAGDSIEAGTTYSRFRLSTDASLTGTIDNDDSIGNLPNGEVEDHQFDIGSSGAGGGITTPADCIFIGQQDVELTVTFDNTGAIPGYGPFVLLYLDKTGADGAGTATDDGLTFKTAQYLGVDVVQQEYTFDANGEAQVTIGNQVETITAPPGFEPGDTVVYMELPFGSFVPDQPPADIAVTVDVSDLADNNTPLNVLSQTGYKFGEDPLDNPDSDPIILEDISAKPNDTITPQIVKITNNYLGPEDETATGPNFVQQYQIVVDIAPGQTLTNLDVSDLLPDTMQFVDVASIEIADSGAGGVNNGVVISDISTPDDGGLTSIGSTNTTENDVNSDGNPTPGGTLTRRFSSVTGVDGADDIVITVDFFVPRLDASGDVIINADTGDDVFDQNQSQLGDNVTTDANNIWTANDTRDGDAEVYIAPTIDDVTPDPVDPASPKPDGTTDTGLTGYGDESDGGDICNDPDHVLEEQSIAIQKNVSNTTDSGNSPGDILEYTLEFQVSDYFAFQDIIVTDTFSDGQRFNTGFTPIVNITEQGGTATGNLDFTYSGYIPANDTLPGSRSGELLGETLIIDETDIDNVNDGSGNTVLTFNVSDELIASSFDPQLIGGGVPQGGFQDIADLNNNPPLPNGGTVGTITFQTIIQDEYNDNFPSGDASLDQNDLLTNDAVIDGAVLDVLDPNNTNDPNTPDALTPTGQREDDDTTASLNIEEGNLFKTIYAVNGVIAPGADTDNNLSDGLDGYASGVEVAPGDTITYRLTYQLPISDVEELQFTDFFPLPVFDVGTEFANPTFSTTFDTTGATIPAAGETHYGRLDTFHSLTGAPDPTLSLDAAGNSLNYFYGDFDDPNNTASVVDLLVTVTTENDPFADNLLLTNQVRQSQENTFEEVSTRDAIVQITLREPVLEIKKGVVAVDSDRTDLAFDPTTASPSDITFTPGSAPTFSGDGVSSTDLDTAPIDSNLTGGLEAGDIVTFALAVENTGGSRKGAFDVRIQDILPDGFEIPAGGLNLNVTDGTGATLTYTGLGDPQGVGNDLFGNGIELTDPGNTPSTGSGLTAETDAGALDGYSDTSGTNLAIISYDLRVTTPSPYVDPATLENTARVVSYSNLEGGESFPSIEDNATVEIERPEAIKSIVTTSEAHTPETGDGSNNANARETTIGEIVRYRLVARIPEGNAVNFILRDGLPNGQTFLNDGTSTVAFVSNGGGISSSNPNGSTLNLGLGTTPANTGNSSDDATNFVTLGDNAIGSTNSITNNVDTYNTGTDVRFKLGDIVNSDRDADDEFIVIEFNALVDNNNVGDNQRNDAGDIKNNNFQIISDGTTLDTSNNVRVETVEPVIDNVDQTVSLDGTNFTESVNADSQDTVTFKVTFSNTGSSTAYDVNLTDNLPAGLENFTFDPNSNVTLSNGATGAAVNPNANPDNELDLIVDAIPVGGSVTVTYTAQVVNGVAPDQNITNTADVTYTSLPGTGTTSNPTGSTTPGTSGATNGERDGSDGEGVNPNDYADSDPATVNTPPLNPIKSIVATSESFTGVNEGASATDSDLTIGEIARYRMVVQIPEGNTNNLVISDLLPTGLRYLDDGTSQVALVSDGGLTSNAIADNDPASPNLASNDPNVTPEFDITASDSADAGTTFESGEDPTFNLGNLTNTDSDANSEFVVIEFNALVENITANQDPGTLDNSFSVDADNATARTSNVVTIDLVEPVINNVQQTVSLDGTNFSESVNADSQDTVTFQVTFSNTGNSTAYEVDITDTLPTGELENLSVTNITSAGGVTGITDTSNTTDLNLDVESIPVGGSVTVTYTAQVVDGVAPDQNITNTADVTYTSLPGTGTASNPTGSTTPGTSGATNGERDGSDGEGIDPNNYADSDPADVNINSYSIGSTVFADTNNNGILDAGETGIAGVTVQLFDNANNEIPVGPDGKLGTADDALGGVTTNGDGNYIFTGLEPGQYQVKIPVSNFDPNGALDNASLSSPNTTTTDNQIDNDDNGIQSELGTEVTSPIITLSAGDEPTTAETAPGGNLDDASDDDANGDMTVDFGFVPTASLGRFVFQDLNGDGIQNGSDFGVNGVTVNLIGGGADGVIVDNPATPEDESADNTTQTTTTINGGQYNFFDLIPGVEYQVQFDPTSLPIETVFTQANVGSDESLDSDADRQTGLTDIVTLAPGEFNEEIDAGIVDTASLGDFVFFDDDGDGIQDNNEFGVDGVDVNLIGGGADGIIVDNPATPEDESADNTTQTTTTSGGFYQFDGLIPGVEYQVEFDETTLPQGTAFTQADRGNDESLDSDVDANGLTEIITLAPGETNFDVDAGIREVVSIGSTVFTDENDNGLQDPGEAGIAGVTVQLFDSTGTTEILVGADGILGTADDATGGVLTDGNGNYFFDGLPEGDYRVVIPNSNFTPGGALENTPLSSHLTNINDDGFDGDDNGIQTEGIGTEVTSPIISLIPGSEPIDTTTETAQGNTQDNLRDANGDMTVDFGFVPKNIVTGTGGSDVINTTNGTTAGNDFIIGGAGQDTLTGGAGNDCFHFNRTSDGIDIITDFDTNGDVLDFSDLFAPGGELAGVTITNDPITDGYIEVVDANPSTLIQVDFDPNDNLFNKNVVLLENVSSSTIDANDFIF